MSIKASVGSIILASSGRNSIITFQHIVIQVFWEITRLDCTSSWLCFQALKNLSLWRKTLTNHRSFQRESVPIGCAPAGGRCLVFFQQISTWLAGHKLSHFTAKPYTARCFLKTFEVRNRHYSNRILIHIWSALLSLTVWSEFASDWQPALIDSSWTADSRSALTGCFPPVCEILQMPY